MLLSRLIQKAHAPIVSPCLLVGLGLSLASSALASSTKTLFRNGVYAAAYGDFGVDKGEWNGENLSAFRAKAGLQLARFDIVSLGLGYQKNGFYVNRSWGRSEGKANIDYRGPVIEINVLPEGLFFGSFAYSSNEGYLFRKENNASTYPYQGCDGTGGATCTIALERDRLAVNEMVLQAGVKMASELYLTLGFGTRQITGHPSYEVYTSDPNESVYVNDDGGKWKESASFFMIGVRGSKL